MSENDPTFSDNTDPADTGSDNDSADTETPSSGFPAPGGSGQSHGTAGAPPNPWSAEGAAQTEHAQPPQHGPQPPPQQQQQPQQGGQPQQPQPQQPQAEQHPPAAGYGGGAQYPQVAPEQQAGSQGGVYGNPYAPPGGPAYPGGPDVGDTGGMQGHGVPGMAPVPAGPERPKRRRTTKLVLGVAVLALLVGGGAGTVGGYLAAEDSSRSSISSLDQERPAKQTGGAPDGTASAVAQKVSPSVVQLKTVTSQGAGEGSGFVISDDGYVLTNNHVIAGAADGGRIQVVFNDGQTTRATVVGRDPTTDIAVVKAQDVSNLPAVELGRSDDLRVGQQVVAIGSPYELAGTVTSGIVSSLHRPVSAGRQGDQTTVMDAIQTDAAINPGNSGGPLVDMNGRIIGINSAIYSPSSGASQDSGNVGIGFAIPIDQARRTADDIMQDGHATQTFIGARVGDARQGGAAIASVEPDSPAEKSGLQGGDVVVKIGDRRVDDSDTLVAAIRTRAPGQKVTLTLEGGKTVEVTLGGQPVGTN
ncbi:trypsin-like peptidase domain-containing protein [Prauserella halophila]|uniref:Trypsin-like peptidase domain-containing protein n=1 Tax=Prauserella halophila TaxID=185641 RepID=A0ABP4GWC4_9PSEU|nr:trypsin-like peptidase domain-containing protein [Prauserella halophila]MCP2235762.1 putative serine protease PepD [Prauserella halophila]